MWEKSVFVLFVTLRCIYSSHIHAVNQNEIQSKHVAKCCKSSEILILSGSSLTCEPNTLNETEFYLTKFHSTWGLPACYNKSYNHVSNFSTKYRANCLDLMYNIETQNTILAAVFCGRQKEPQPPTVFPKKEILQFRSCCHSTEIFDYNTRTCRVLNKYQNMMHLFPREKYILSRYDFPYCDGYLIDYLIERKMLKITENNNISIVLPNGKLEDITNNQDEICIHTTRSSKLVARVCEDSSVCKSHLCIKKCCKFGEKMNYLDCIPMPNDYKYKSFHQALKTTNNPSFENFRRNVKKHPDYGVMADVKCNKIRTQIKTHDWYLSAKGKVNLYSGALKHDSYCVDLTENRNQELDFTLAMCEKPPNDRWAFWMKTLLLCSCLSTFITIIIYKLIPPTYYFHELCHMCHLGFYFIGLCLVFIGDIRLIPVGPYCEYWGYISQFFLIYGFSWLNVMFYDTWQTIRGMKSILAVHKPVEYPITLYSYCLYAWGISCLVILVTILCENIDGMLPIYRPYLSSNTCWFHAGENYGLFFYFALPIIIQMIANICFVILTSIDCYYIDVQINTALKESKIIKKKIFNERKDQFNLNIKLMIALGLPLMLKTILDLFVLSSNTSIFVYNLLCFSEFLESAQGVSLILIALYTPNVREQLKTIVVKQSNNFTSKKDYITQKAHSNSDIAPVEL